jgi:cytochrome c peroxidase
VPVPRPDNIEDFIKNEDAAIILGKALFWDMQVGSDGIQACASCHFNAGADSRTKNQLTPGLNRVNADGSPNPDTAFGAGKGPNYQLTAKDFPFHNLADPNNRNSTVLNTTNDVTSSQGVFFSLFKNVVPGRATDNVDFKPDPVGFRVGNVNVRRVEPRQTPTMINAVFNFRNFWDGRAQNDFNGVNSFGERDPDAFLYRADGKDLVATKVSLNNSSLASQAVAPPVSPFEMSADGRTFQDIGNKFSQPMLLMSFKVFPLRPLGKQLVHPKDSVLGKLSLWPLTGLNTTYEALIKSAFKPEWWSSKKYIQVNPNGNKSIVSRKTTPNTFTQMEYNFSLFFGLAVQMYEATLVSDDAPIDRFAEGDESALTAQQIRGLTVFQTRGCGGCHTGSEFTNASVGRITTQGLTRVFLGRLIDEGFFNIGVNPTLEDFGVGGKDPFGNTLSEAKESSPTANTAVLGAFKAPSLRNVELTAPYMHNGGFRTIRQVLDFYGRNGNFQTRGAPDEIDFLGLFAINFGDDPTTPEIDTDTARAEQEKKDLAAFLTALTDERVRNQKAPFDHPQLFVPNGHPGDHLRIKKADNKTGNAIDNVLQIPAVGRNGGKPLNRFLQ